MARRILHLSIPVHDLAEARWFYETVLGCDVGRTRESWFDVWFFGLQLTLQLRPDEVSAVDDQGVRHFGVVLDERAEFDAVVERIVGAGVEWLVAPHAHDHPDLSGKFSGKLADPSGNVIEIKHYADVDAQLSR